MLGAFIDEKHEKRCFSGDLKLIQELAGRPPAFAWSQ